MRWFKQLWLLVLMYVVLLLCWCDGAPVSKPEAAFEIMSQIPQWHCLRYRKFELVRRCRSYKNGVRRL